MSSSNGSAVWKIHMVGAGACLLLFGAAYFVGVEPVLDTRSTDREQEQRLVELRQRSQSAVESLATLRTTLHQTEQDLAQTPLRLESVAQVNQRLARLADLALRNGLSIDQVRPGAAQREGKFAAMPIHVTASGSYPTCVRFIHAVRAELVDTEVRALHISGRPSPDPQQATFECDLVWYAAPADAMVTVDLPVDAKPITGAAP